MPVGAFQIFDETIEAMAKGTLGSLDGVPITGVLLGSGYTPGVTTHATYQDLSATELSGGDYAQVAVTGAMINDEANGIRFLTDDVAFGASVTIAGAKYLALVKGVAGTLNALDPVIGVQDLDDSSGTATVASTNSIFTVQTPATGWFEITRV